MGSMGGAYSETWLSRCPSGYHGSPVLPVKPLWESSAESSYRLGVSRLQKPSQIPAKQAKNHEPRHVIPRFLDHVSPMSALDSRTAFKPKPSLVPSESPKHKRHQGRGFLRLVKLPGVLNVLNASCCPQSFRRKAFNPRVGSAIQRGIPTLALGDAEVACMFITLIWRTVLWQTMVLLC